MYYDFYLYTREFANFKKAFEIVKEIVESVDQQKLLNHNFNRYSEEGDDNRPHITLRMNLTDEKEKDNVMEKLSVMKDLELIDDFSDSSPTVQPFKCYSADRHSAHETSTKSAFKFHDKKVESPESFEEFENNRITFLTEFIPLWLKNSGFSFQGVNNISDSSSALVNDLAQECGSIVRSLNVGEITDMHDFSERLIHTLMNSISIPRNHEEAILDNVAQRLGYDTREELLLDLTLHRRS